MSPRAVSTVRTVFRVVAFAEAASWLALLVAMFHKYLIAGLALADNHRGVAITGMLHGAVFLMAFIVMSIVAWRVFDWRLRTLALALASSIPPFATVWFERRADRRGQLGVPDASVGLAAQDAR